jgi:hypothetical protein
MIAVATSIVSIIINKHDSGSYNKMNMQIVSSTFADVEPENASCCRICLGPCARPAFPYCNCRGSLEYLHQRCVLEWAQRTPSETDKHGNYFFLCDVCKSPMYVEVERRCCLKSCDEICAGREVAEAHIKILLIALALALTVLIMCLNFLLIDTKVNFILLITVIIAGIATLAFACILFFKLCLKCK